MIVKNFELKNFINKKKLFLIYGENEGLKEDLILEFSKDYSKENTFNYSEKEIFLNLENFYNNIFSQSFFEKKKLIIVNNASEKIKGEIELILTKNIENITLIFLSNILEKKSKLRNLFEKDKNLICVAVYKDDHRVLFNLANSFFKSKKIDISTESINLIIERSSEDRKHLRNELKKIDCFIGNKKKIDINDLIKLTNLSENHSINKIVDMSLAKDTKQSLRALNENIFSADDIIIIIRSYLIKSKRLLKLTTELERNKNIDQVISASKPPIFWKDKDVVKKQLKIWNKESTIALIQNINEVELQLKKNAGSSLNILQNFIIEQSLKPNT
ncbi:DNA polymerase III subunit delta [Candidatus Pelagibacter sp.]|nr:DNA polymerase III subunit delta [Candidatus Pelagibacter sp.]